MSFKIQINKPTVVSVDPQPAAKHFDIILGLDFHLLLIPPSPVPIPFPVIPFGALVFDPMDYIHVTIPAMPAFVNGKLTVHKNVPMGGTVLINGFYRAATTSGLMAMPPTVPPMLGKVKGMGSVVAKISPLHMAVPKTTFFVPFLAPHDGQIAYGSETVNTQGNKQSTMTCQVFSCAHVGRVVPTNPMGFFNNYATAIVAVLPMGKPVLVGGKKVEHKFSIDDLLNALMFMGIMKGGGKLIKKLLGKLLTKLNQILSKAFPKFRKYGDAIQPAICKYLGEPVDAGTGHMASLIQGFSLPGPIPFCWEANYYSDSTYDGPLGKNIYHSYDISLIIDKAEGIVAMNDTAGRAVVFPTLLPGESFFNPAEKYELYRNEEGEYYVINQSGLLFYFNSRPDKEGYYNLRSIANRNGFAIRFAYNHLHLLEHITDSAGRKIMIENNGNGQITALRMLHPNMDGSYFEPVRYDYDQNSCMTAFYDAEGYSNKMAWDQRKIVSRTFADGTTFIFEYDKEGKCTAALGPDGLYSYRFDYFEDHTIVTNSLGYKSIYFHHDGIVTRILNPQGGERFFNYDEFNNLLAETDENGIVKSFEYDDRGNLIELATPGKGSVKITYNSLDKPEKTIQPNGGEWDFEYDEAGNLISRTNPEGITVGYQYTDGLIESVTNYAGTKTHLEYDPHFNLTKVQLPNGLLIQYQYDFLGRCTLIKSPKGNPKQLAYNLRGDIIGIKEPDGNIRKIAYDAMGNPISATDKHYNIRFTYNFFGDVMRRVQGGSSIGFYYDKEGQLTAVENEHGEIYQFKLDTLGNVINEIGFDGLRRDYLRDAGGRVVQVQVNEGKAIGYDYNSGGQLSKVLYENGHTESYDYDAMGDLVQAVNQAAETEFSRDIMGRIVKEKCNGDIISSQFDLLGNRIHVTSSLGADIQLNYNKESGLAEGIKANHWETNFQYNPLGELIEKQLPGNIIQGFEYDEVGRLTKQSLRQNHHLQHQRQYIWDVDFRLSKIIDSDQGQKIFNHDFHGNLAEVVYSDGTTQYRMPDKVGNLFETKDRNDRNYGKAGKLLKSKTAKFHYDGEGNLIEKRENKGKSWKYEWNEAGMLEKVVRPDGFEVTFGYDALGRRLWKRFKNTVTKWLWDGNVPLHEWKEHAETGEKLGDASIGEDGIITWIFEESSFIPTAKIKDNKNYSIISDHLGTPFQMYREDGTKFWENELDSYGKTRKFIGEKGSCPFRYQGQYEDIETGLYYNRFRYYASEEGIYLSQDPIGLLGGSDLYGYVSDTNSWVDIFGLSKSIVYQLVRNGEVVYYGITNRSALERMAEHGKTKAFDSIEILAEGLTHHQARSIEGALIRNRMDERLSIVDRVNLSIEEQLMMSGLDNKNRGRISERWKKADGKSRSFNPLKDLKDKMFKKPKKVKVGCKS